MMLNLFEFMEHDEKPLPIEAHKLRPPAEPLRVCKGALHYRDRIPPAEPIGARRRRCCRRRRRRRRRCRRRSGRCGGGRRRRCRRCRAAARRAAAPTLPPPPPPADPAAAAVAAAATIDSLISINNQLGLPDAAAGILAHYRKGAAGRPDPRGMVREVGPLGRRARRVQGTTGGEPARDSLGARAAALRARARRVEGSVRAGGRGVGGAPSGSRLGRVLEVARLGAAGAQSRQVGAMAEYVGAMGEGDEESTFYRAVLATRAGRWGEARSLIDAARRGADSELHRTRARVVPPRVPGGGEGRAARRAGGGDPPPGTAGAAAAASAAADAGGARLAAPARLHRLAAAHHRPRARRAPGGRPPDPPQVRALPQVGRRALAHNLLARLLGPAAQAEVERAAEEGVPSLEILSVECSPAVVLAAAKQPGARRARGGAADGRRLADDLARPRRPRSPPRAGSSSPLAACGSRRRHRSTRAARQR